MRINATKTKEMVICFCHNDSHVASIPRIVIDNNDIERVTQANVGETGVGCHTGWLSHCQYLIRWMAAPCGDLHVTCA